MYEITFECRLLNLKRMFVESVFSLDSITGRDQWFWVYLVKRFLAEIAGKYLDEKNTQER